MQSLSSEIKDYLQNIASVEGKDMYNELVKEKCLCGLKEWTRVLREVTELNKEFHSLRTYMAPVSDIVGVLHFLIYPADGAFADKPLCGRVLISSNYPQSPPVVHLLTKTGRYNVDVYSCYGERAMFKYMHSTMCFDILRASANGGTWMPEFTISSLMASLIQSIVTMKVPQEHGPEIEEYVTMEKLNSTNYNVNSAFNQFGNVMPPQQKIKKVIASPVSTKHFEFPSSFQSPSDDNIAIFQSQSISLQVSENLRSQNVYSIGFDLSDLQNNPYTVFSIILTNDPSDVNGKKKETVLVRNGVTATAAKKLKKKAIKWFYHGKPMNQSNLKLIVTVGYDQFSISYMDKDNYIVHGDCPVSFLTSAEIGSVEKDKFYLCVMMKNKTAGLSVKVNTFLPDYGYLHPIYSGVDQDNISFIEDSSSELPLPKIIKSTQEPNLKPNSENKSTHVNKTKEINYKGGKTSLIPIAIVGILISIIFVKLMFR